MWYVNLICKDFFQGLRSPTPANFFGKKFDKKLKKNSPPTEKKSKPIGNRSAAK